MPGVIEAGEGRGGESYEVDHREEAVRCVSLLKKACWCPTSLVFRFSVEGE